MASDLALAHMEAQRRLRAVAERGIVTAWAALPGYDRANVDEWLSAALPLTRATQEQSVALTEAYLTRALNRPTLGLDAGEIIAAGVRPGVDPEEIYTRPFVTVWTALRDGTLWADAVAAGRARAVSLAVTDVQLAMRATLAALEREENR